jgi:multiple antibiotic resistance protein
VGGLAFNLWARLSLRADQSGGAVPIYSRLVRKTSPDRTHRILLVASLAVGCLLIVAALWGESILAFFSVGLERAEADADLHAIAITPLAFPQLVGPAEMSVIITFSNDTPARWAKGLLVASAALTTALIVASVAIDFILSGLKNQFPGLK